MALTALRSFATFFRLAASALLAGPGAAGRPTLRRLGVMLLFLPAMFALMLSHFIGLALDEVFFRGYRRVRVEKPLFIIGVPRSGTTSLYQALAQDTENFTCLKLWELIFAPSVTQRRVIQGLWWVDQRLGGVGQGLIRRIERWAAGSMDDVHAVSLEDPEEDYFLLAPVFGCLLLNLPFPDSRAIWRLVKFDSEVPPDERRRLLDYYESCLKRHLYAHGGADPEHPKRLLSKNPTFCGYVASLAQRFEDARFLCTNRSPLEAVPSLISSMQEGVRLFDNHPQGTAYRDRLVAMMEHYYLHPLRVLGDWPADRCQFVTLPQMKRDLQGVVRGVYERFGLRLTTEFEHRLSQRAESARAHRSGHRYAKPHGGVDPWWLYRDLREVFERFGYDPPQPSPEPPAEPPPEPAPESAQPGEAQTAMPASRPPAGLDPVQSAPPQPSPPSTGQRGAA